MLVYQRVPGDSQISEDLGRYLPMGSWDIMGIETVPKSPPKKSDLYCVNA